MAENLLGKHTPLVEHYSPELLYAIDRAEGRSALGLEGPGLPFAGEDVWHAWELSWIGSADVPRSAVGRFSVPCDSSNLVESKSFKLYLNSLNQARYGSDAELVATLHRDLSEVAGAPVGVELLALDDPGLQSATPPGICLDSLEPATAADQPLAELLQLSPGVGAYCFYSHLLRSLCPVTGQPDWATLIIELRGSRLLPESLLTYILSYRRHREFHEQCVERVYRDISRACSPDFLSVQALYTRRGGLDINPWRCSEAIPAPRLRTGRQ